MKRWQGKGFWFAIAILFGFGIAQLLTTNAGTLESLVGKKAPAFELKSVEGETVELSALQGKVVLLDFWAVWCGPCRQSMPFFEDLQKKYGKDGLEVIGVHVDDRMPPAKEVGEYLSKLGVTYTNVVSTVATDDAFLVYAMPTTYLIDRKGVVAEQHIGFNPDTAPEEIEGYVKELLAAK